MYAHVARQMQYRYKLYFGWINADGILFAEPLPFNSCLDVDAKTNGAHTNQINVNLTDF